MNHSFIGIAKEFLRVYQKKTKDNRYNINRAIKLGNKVQLNNICLYEIKGEQLYFYDNEMVQLVYDHYPIRFSIPKSAIIWCDTKELNKPQRITINQWAYEEIYQKIINNILMSFGRHMSCLLNANTEMPLLRHSNYYNIISKLQIQKAIRDRKKS